MCQKTRKRIDNYMKYTKLITTLAVTAFLSSNLNVGIAYATENATVQAGITSQNPDVQKAIDAVNALFTDNTHTALAPTTTSQSIKDAKKLVTKILTVNHSYALELGKLCMKATDLLNK